MKEEIHALQNYDGHINTYSGLKINLLDPQPEQINIRDIARGLAYNCHFGGQTPKFFSIAEHSILVTKLMHDDGVGDPEILMCALLHDGSEAYLGDMVKPLKLMLPEFQEIEGRMQTVIDCKYRVNHILKEQWKPFDERAQELEYQSFFKGEDVGLSFFRPEHAYRLYMGWFWSYLNARERLSAAEGAKMGGKELNKDLAN